MMPRGAKGLLYRPFASASGQRRYDRNGDPIDSDGNVVRATSPGTFIGELRGILMGGPSASANMRERGEDADTTGKFGIPLANQTPVKFNDRIVIGEETYKVTSRPDWAYPNSITGTKPTYAWVSVEATTSG